MNINELQRDLTLVYNRVSGGKDLNKCGYKIEDHVTEDNETGYTESAIVIINDGVCVKVYREWVENDDTEDFELFKLEDESIDLDLHSLMYRI